jgi:hypothetical protein
VNQTYKTFAGFLLFFVVIMFLVTQSNQQKSKIAEWTTPSFMTRWARRKVKADTISEEDRLIGAWTPPGVTFKVSPTGQTPDLTKRLSRRA